MYTHSLTSASIETAAFLDLSYSLEKAILQLCNKLAD